MAAPRSEQLPPQETDRRTEQRAASPRTAHHDAIFTLARASELHDEDTGEHLLRIRHIVEHIALELGFEVDDAAALGYDAMLHDVGKLYIPPRVLQKPGALSPTERDIMESHTVRGERMLSGQESMLRASRIARSHHEAWNGSGYPDGLVGDAIPLEARITTAADILDALLASRCYKRPWSYEDAMKEVLNMRGEQIDPDVADALDRCNRSGALCDVFGVSDRCVDPLPRVDRNNPAES